jgi:hypothetical protein
VVLVAMVAEWLMDGERLPLSSLRAEKDWAVVEFVVV